MNRNCNAGYTNWNYNRTRRFDQQKQITLPPLVTQQNYLRYVHKPRRAKTAHSVPSPSPPGLGRSESCAKELGNGQLIWVCSPSQLLQQCRYLHLPKGQRHCPSFQEWQKGGTRLVSREAAGSGADAVEEDDRGGGGEAMAGDL